MFGLIEYTNHQGGRIISDDGVRYGFSWRNALVSPADVGHDSPVSFSAIEEYGNHTALRVMLDHDRFKTRSTPPKKKRFVPASVRTLNHKGKS